MGTEFLKRTRPSAKKYADKKRADLCAPGLFKADPETLARKYVAKAEGRANLHAGDSIQIEAEGPGIILRRDGQVVGRSECPPPGLREAVTEAGGFFPGSVSNVHSISPTFEFCMSAVIPGPRPHA